MPSESASHRYRRGELSPSGDGMLFWRYKGSKEEWRTREAFDSGMKSSRKSSTKQRQKPEHKEWMKLYFRQYNNTPKSKAYRTGFYKSPEVREKIRKHYATDPEMRRKSSAYAKSERGKEVAKKSRLKRIDSIREYMREYRKKWTAIPTNRIGMAHRHRIQSALKERGIRKNSKTAQMLGCTFAFFRGYLEAQFTEGMTWGNYATRWECDHKTPISAFDLTDPAQLKTAFHYTNCQPLWKEANRAKSDRIPGELFRGRHYARKVIPFTKAA